MVATKDIRWFKETFYKDIAAATKNTIFDPDMLIAIASQETGSLWAPMRRKGLAKDEIVRLCCGDTLDEDKGRRAFPRTKAHLVAVPNGQKMFDIAREALLAMAEHVPGYGFAKTRKNKFCHGYGVFQYDLQFFKVDPDYFLEKRYEKFANTLGKALQELTSAAKKRGLDGRSSITDFEFTTIAITYNTGGFRASKGLKQGHFDGSKFYGEHIRDYIAIARSIPNPDGAVPEQPTGDGPAVVTPPVTGSATGPKMMVDTKTTTLRLRSEPKISKPATKNVIADLPDDLPVRAFTGNPVNGFIEIEAVLNGTTFRGFSSAKFLKKATSGAAEPPPPPAAGTIPAVDMPRSGNSVTKRTAIAGAHSLNEPGMPSRKGATPEELRAELGQFVAWLNPEKKAHKRYQPRSGATFCNIYAHDFCTLAGVYLPRVWWKENAITQILAGQSVKPRYESTIREMRANDIFRWLEEYGAAFGWQRASTLSILQENANLGAVALVIARRRIEGRSGHVAMVVPETDKHAARRNGQGEVTAPLQSQAGSRNFNYGPGTTGWWNGAQFAASAFWYHA